MGISVGAAAMLALVAYCAAASAGAFEKVRGWGPLVLGMDLAEAREALSREGIEYREKFVMKDGTTRMSLSGEAGEGVCYFDGERRLMQILFTGPQLTDKAEAKAAESRAMQRHGPPDEILSRVASDGTREERVLLWRNTQAVLTVTVAHSLPDGGWVLFQNYTRPE